MTEKAGIPASRISIIIPVLNEAACLQAHLQRLQPWRAAGHEVIVVDGGSHDGSERIASKLADKLLGSASGRARQMNAGAAGAAHDILLFLHADTVLPDFADQQIIAALQQAGAVWGRFNVSLDSPRRIFRIIEQAVNLRSALSGIATGDQAIFVGKREFLQVGAYDEIPLMEDVALSKKLRRLAWPVCLRTRVSTSARRWQQQGICHTVLLMWRLRLAYFLGISPERLVRRYYPGRHE